MRLFINFLTMYKKKLNVNIFLYSILIFFSFFINFYYANIGVFPIDTFAFFDTAYNILIDRHPFRDIWITTGPVVDYFQAFFFKAFGLNWYSYVIHSSFLNAAFSIFFFLTLRKFDLDKYLSFFYSLCFSILGYTVSGTPFAYLHSYILSLFAFLIFIRCIKFKSNYCYFFLPIFLFFAFFSMQNPSTFFILIISTLLIVNFFFSLKTTNLLSLISGTIFSLIIFYVYLNLTDVSIQNIWNQYFLFPLSIGEYRTTGNDIAHISLAGRATWRNIFGHFKFIDFFIFLYLVITTIAIYKKRISNEDIIINLSFILMGLSLIFNQLITSNQTYIFSIIPFLGGFFHIFYKKYLNNAKKFNFFIFILVLFCTVKYHLEYNEKRKFMDLQNVDLKYYEKGNNLDKKLNGLKWASNFPDKKKEIYLLKEAKNLIVNEAKSKMVLTEYQIFSILAEQNLNIPNRWYTHDNNSYPLKNHKYFSIYKEHINKIMVKENVQIIFTIDPVNLENFYIYFDNFCFNKTKLNPILYSYKKISCN